MLRPGDKMPSFALIDHAERVVASDDFAGRWYLLYWYPKADTPGCTAQAIGLRDQHDAFEALDCTVLGASFDEPADNAAFRAKFGLPFRLLSDRERGVARRVGAADDDGATHAQRIAHLVRPDGKIERSYLVEDPEFFAEQVLDDLEAAQGDGVG